MCLFSQHTYVQCATGYTEPYGVSVPIALVILHGSIFYHSTFMLYVPPSYIPLLHTILYCSTTSTSAQVAKNSGLSFAQKT